MKKVSISSSRGRHGTWFWAAVSIAALVLLTAVGVYLVKNDVQELFPNKKDRRTVDGSESGEAGLPVLDGDVSRTSNLAQSGVTPVPTVWEGTRVRIRDFQHFDLDKNGVYGPVEFARAMYRLATTEPLDGFEKLPKWHHDQLVSGNELRPLDELVLLNKNSDEFLRVDRDNNWRIDESELQSAGLLTTTREMRPADA